MAQKFTVPISIRQLTSASSQGLSIRLDGETEDRIRIEAGGRILWSDGSSVTGMDINLYRDGADLLKTDDTFEAAGGLITLTTSGTPTATLGDGAIAIDTTNDTFYFRSNGTWQEVSGGGGASVTVSDTAPVAPEAGNLWYESDTGSMFIYYDDGDTSQWVEVGGSSVVAMFTSDTPPSSPTNGDLWFESDTGKTYLYYNDGTSGQWVEIGAASATVANGADGYIQFANLGVLDSSADLFWDDANSRLGIGTTTPSTAVEVVGTVTATTFDGDLTGNATTASALETARTIELTGDVTGTTVFDGSANVTINASVTAEVSSIDNLSDVIITGAQDGELLIYNGTDWVNDTLPTSEPMGHEDRTASTISFNSGTRVFSIAPVSSSHTVWCAGVRYVKTTTETVTLPTTPALYYIYYDTSGVLQYQTSYFTWHEDTPTAYLYWNGTDYLLFDERHGITLDWATHEYLHRTRGAVIANGLGASNYVIDGVGDSDSHTQIDIADGTFFDEDLQVDITHSATPAANSFEQVLQGAAEIPIMYLSGTTWTFDAATTFPLKLGSSLPTYNLDTAGTWSTPDLGNGTFGVTWIVATNILGSPVIGIMGQEEYNNIGQAEAAEWSNLYMEGFPVVEMRPLFKVAFEVKTSYTNTNSAAIRGVYDLRRYGAGSSSIPAFPVSDHGSLTGLSDDDHPQYLTEARHDAHDHSAAMASVTIYDISNVSASSPTAGEFLKYDGTSWTSSDVTLGTETTGDYVESLVAGTGVTLTNNTGEGATPTVEIGQDVSTTANVTFNTVNADLTGDVTGNASTASALQTSRTISLGGDLSGSALFDGSADITISATIGADSVDLGTDTTGDYVESLVAGTGVSLLNNTGEGATPTIYIGQDVGTGASVTFASVNAPITGDVTGNVTGDLAGDVLGDLTGDVYASDGTSKVLEAGTNGTDATFTGDVTGNASTASALETARTIELTGEVTGSASFDGSANISISTTIQADTVALGTDTTGDYIESITGGTGVTVFNGTGEGASVGIEIGQDVSTTANVTFNDLIVTGDLTVNGNTTTVDTATLTVEDPLIILASNNNTTDSVDIGFYGLYDTSGSQDLYAGLFRDSTDGKFRLFVDSQTAPTTTVDTTATGYTVASLVANIEGDLTGDVTGTVSDISNHNLGDLGDVDFTVVTPAQGDVVYYDGADWVNYPLTLTNVGGVDLTSSSPTTGDFLKFDGTNWVPDAVDLGTDTTGDYVESLVAGTGVSLLNNTGEGATPTIYIGQDVGTGASVTFAHVAADLTGSITGDVYAGNGTSKVLDNGTNGTDATFIGAVTGTVSDISNHDLGDLGDVNFTIVTPAQGDVVYYDGAEWVNFPLSIGDVGGVNFTTTPTTGDFLKFDGSDWVPDAIDLGTDTTGDYVESLVAGTGVSLSNNSGEGATPTVYIGQDVGTNASVTFDHVTGTYGVTTITTTGVPTVSAPDGTIAVDTTNDTFYFISNGTWQEVSGGGASVTVSDTPPSAPEAGNLWFESDTGLTFIYYDDGDTTQWVEVGGGAGIRSYMQDAAPSSPLSGDIWFETDTGVTYIYYDDGSSAQWVEVGVGGGGGGGGASVTVSDTAPADPTEGDMWFESDTGKLLVYYDSVWVEVGGTGGGGSSSSTITSSSTDAAILLMEIGP